MRIILSVALATLLAGCQVTPPVRCMTDKESGTVVQAKTINGEYCGRYGCTPWTKTYVVVSMGDGVTRTCSIQDSIADMLTVGQKVNLSGAERLY